MSSLYLERISSFQKVLNPETEWISFEQLRQLCFYGIPDVKNIRALCWKILLNYLPSNKKEWNTVLKEKRKTYKELVLDLCTESSETYSPGTFVFKDHDLLITISKDVRRTLSNISFFQTQRSMLFAFPLPTLQEVKETHYQVIERILYLYAKLNPGIGYIQGMTYFVFPVYYLLASNTNVEEDQVYAESDTFFMFHEIVTDYRDFFMHSMDKDLSSGLTSAYRDLAQRLHQRDQELAEYLNSLSIQPDYYALRWYTCLCAQELELPSILRLWDTLFSDRLSARKRAVRETRSPITTTTNIITTTTSISTTNSSSSFSSSPSSTSSSSSSSFLPFLQSTSSHSMSLSKSPSLPSSSLHTPPLSPTTPLHSVFLTEYLVSKLILLRPMILHQPFDVVLHSLQSKPWDHADEVLEKTYSYLTTSTSSSLETKLTQFLKQLPMLKRKVS